MSKKRTPTVVGIKLYDQLHRRLSDMELELAKAKSHQHAAEELLENEKLAHKKAVTDAVRALQDVEASRDRHRERADIAIERAARAEGYVAALLDKAHPPKPTPPWEAPEKDSWS